MTYCVGMLLKEGLVMICDTRANVGVDNIASFSKPHIIAEPGERVIALASSGNLSITQSVVSLLTEGVPDPETGEAVTLQNAPTMFKAAQLVGRAVREIYRIEQGEPYFEDLHQRWSEALRATHQAIPKPPYAKKV